MNNKLLLLIFFSFACSRFLSAQPWMEAPYLEINGPQDEWKQTNFYEIQKAYYAYEEDYLKNNPVIELHEQNNFEEEENQVPGRLQFKRWENYMMPRVYPSGDIGITTQTSKIFKEYLQRQAPAPVLTSSGNWTSLGPFDDQLNTFSPYLGRVNFVKVHPTNNNILWIGTPGGGLWKSTNAGTTWTPMTDDLSVLACSDLAFDPSNPNIMYLATGDADQGAQSIGILKSTDGGNTWNTTGLSWTIGTRRIPKVIVNPSNPNIVLAATSVGLYRTVNGGTNWTLISSIGTTKLYDVKFKPGDPSVVYVATSGKFYKSTDSAATFTQITTGLPTGTSRFMIGVTPANPLVVYLMRCFSASFSGLYKSVDSGDSFTLQSSTPNITGSQGYFAAAIAVSQINESEVYVGGLNTYRSLDNGVTWTGCANLPSGHVDVHSIDFVANSGTDFYVCSDGGLVITTNKGDDFFNKSEGLAITEVYNIANSFTNSDLVLEGAQDNGTKRLDATGWKQVGGGDGATCIIDYTNPDIMYTSINNGMFFRTLSGTGAFNNAILLNNNSTLENSSGSWITPFTLHPTDHNTMLVAKNSVYRSTDDGLTWNAMPGINIASNPFNLYLMFLHYAPSNPNYIYAYEVHPKFYVSIDGNTFIDRTSTFADTSTNFATGMTVSNTNAQKIWVCFSGYNSSKVFQSNDAGITWTDYSAGLPSIPANTIVYQNGSNDALYLGMDQGIYYRDASMNSWQLFNTGLPNVQISDLKIQYSSGKIRAGTSGRGVWESDLLSVNVTETANPEISISLYPNPSSEIVTLSLNGKWKSQNPEIVIENMLGEIIHREVMTGTLTLINTENLAPGIYSVTALDNSQSLVEKLVVR